MWTLQHSAALSNLARSYNHEVEAKIISLRQQLSAKMRCGRCAAQLRCESCKDWRNYMVSKFQQGKNLNLLEWFEQEMNCEHSLLRDSKESKSSSSATTKGKRGAEAGR